MNSLLFQFLSIFAFGAVIGSFFNVLIWRIPRGESIIHPPSYCPSCQTPIKFYYNIPLIGYLLCGFKCFKCKKPISPIYPTIELVTAIAAIILRFHFKSTIPHFLQWNLILLFVQFCWLLLMVPMSIIDSKHYIIPDTFTIPFIVIGIAGAFLPSGITPLESLLGILAGGGSLYIIGWIGTTILKKEDVMGGGDIKLMAAAGALFGWKLALISIMLGAFLGSFVGMALLLHKRLRIDHKIPFGPFLGIGIWLSVLFGKEILSWYLLLFS